MRASSGGTVLPGTPADFGRLIVEETEKWGKVVKFTGIKADWPGALGTTFHNVTSAKSRMPGRVGEPGPMCPLFRRLWGQSGLRAGGRSGKFWRWPNRERGGAAKFHAFTTLVLGWKHQKNHCLIWKWSQSRRNSYVLAVLAKVSNGVMSFASLS
jgi:hypothetical protein